MAPPGPRSAARSTAASTTWAGEDDLGPLGLRRQDVKFRFRFDTDGGVASEAFIDDVAVTVDGVATTDDVENGAGAWTAAGGFQIINGTTSRQVQDMYLVENRTYGGYDDTLRTGPYNFGWANTKPDWVERFPYQNGMLVWFANGEFDDNNTRTHPGGGQVLPVDARPAPVMFPGGVPARQPSSAVRRDLRSGGHRRGDLPPQRRADDRAVARRHPDVRRLGREPLLVRGEPVGSTKVAGSGTSLTVFKTNDGGDQLQVKVRFR